MNHCQARDRVKQASKDFEPLHRDISMRDRVISSEVDLLVSLSLRLELISLNSIMERCRTTQEEEEVSARPDKF